MLPLLHLVDDTSCMFAKSLAYIMTTVVPLCNIKPPLENGKSGLIRRVASREIIPRLFTDNIVAS